MWPHLGERQRLVWAATLELDAVPMQEHGRGRFGNSGLFGAKAFEHVLAGVRKPSLGQNAAP